MPAPKALSGSPVNGTICMWSASHPLHKNSYSALKEIIAFLSLMVLLNEVFGDGHRFITMNMHPFWIIVLLVTVQYGTREALMASLLASLFLLIGNLPEQNLTETMYGYMLRVTFLPFLWIVTALVLGSIRSRQRIEKEDLTRRVASAEKAKDAIAKSYNTLKHTKERLELRLAEERCSVLSVYNIAKSLETFNPDDADVEVCKLVKQSLNASRFSFYRGDGSGLSLKSAYGWPDTSAYTREFGGNTRLASGIFNEKRVLSITSEEDELLLDGQGILAGPIIDAKTGKIFGMLKVEEIAFMDMGVRTHETFRILCEWVGRVYANIDQYQSAYNRSVQPLLDENKTARLILQENAKPEWARLIPPAPYSYPASKIAA